MWFTFRFAQYVDTDIVSIPRNLDPLFEKIVKNESFVPMDNVVDAFIQFIENPKFNGMYLIFSSCPLEFSHSDCIMESFILIPQLMVLLMIGDAVMCLPDGHHLVAKPQFRKSRFSYVFETNGLLLPARSQNIQELIIYSQQPSRPVRLRRRESVCCWNWRSGTSLQSRGFSRRQSFEL